MKGSGPSRSFDEEASPSLRERQKGPLQKSDNLGGQAKMLGGSARKESRGAAFPVSGSSHFAHRLDSILRLALKSSSRKDCRRRKKEGNG